MLVRRAKGLRSAVAVDERDQAEVIAETGECSHDPLPNDSPVIVPSENEIPFTDRLDRL